MVRSTKDQTTQVAKAMADMGNYARSIKVFTCPLECLCYVLVDLSAICAATALGDLTLINLALAAQIALKSPKRHKKDTQVGK